MASLEAVISAYGALTGKRQKTTVATTMPTSPNRVKRGQVVEHIDTILRSEAAYDEPTIRQKMAECFEIAYIKINCLLYAPPLQRQEVCIR